MQIIKPTKAQTQFIDDLARLLTPWGMPVTAARLYAFLQLQNEPVSLDEIAQALQVSRSNAFTAARLLESHGNARRLGERGTKRILYVAGQDPGAPLRRHTELLDQMARLISERNDSVATGEARKRLDRLAVFHAKFKAALEQVIFPGHSKTTGPDTE
jgi:DNA-binding transcriptional regulator GbsR (MarR family)